MKKIEPARLSLRPFHILDQEWALLVGGREKSNPMTVSWGGLGTLWNRPVATVYVRPTRFTFSLLEREPEFTLNVLPASMKSVLDLCGTRSGRELDKWKAAGISPEPSEKVGAPRVQGAELSLECRVIATFAVEPAGSWTAPSRISIPSATTTGSSSVKFSPPGPKSGSCRSPERRLERRVSLDRVIARP